MTYNYKARTTDGEIKTGEIEAVNEIEAVSKLQNMGLLVLDVSIDGQMQMQTKKQSVFGSVNLFKSPKKKRTKRSKRVKSDEIVMFCDQMAVLLDASVDIIKSLNILALQVTSQPLYDAIIDMKVQVSGGLSLSRAMDKYPKFFPAFIINLIEIGESSGQLADVMKRVAVYLEKVDDVKRKIKGALTYPAILVSVSIIAIFVFLVRIIPIFQRMFDEFNTELPKLTQIVVAISDKVRSYVLIEIIAVVVLVVGAKKMLAMPKYRYKFDKFILDVPILGDLLLKTAVVNFTTSFSVLLANGVSILDSLDMLKAAVGNSYISEIFSKIKRQVKGGGSVSKGLEEANIFPPLVVQMLSVGEETGRLTNMLDKLGEFYDKRVSAAVDTLSAVFEPLILVVMGGIIGVLVIAMFLPIFKVSQIGTGMG